MRVPTRHPDQVFINECVTLNELMSPDSTLTKEPDAPFHMTVETAILVFQANPVRVELSTSHVNTHFLLFNESENAL